MLYITVIANEKNSPSVVEDAGGVQNPEEEQERRNRFDDDLL